MSCAVIARDRHDAGGGDVESDGGDMRGGRARPRRARLRSRRVGGEHVVERHHAVGQIAAEGADMADRKQLGRGQHGGLGLLLGADARAGDDGLGADAAQRGHDLLLAPEQRQRRRDHAGAQHAEQRDHAFDGVGQLQRDHRVGLAGRARAAARRAPKWRGRPRA